MEGSCAVRQGHVACGLSGSDADNLNVEDELSRWLRDLDNSVSLFLYSRQSIEAVLRLMTWKTGGLRICDHT